MPDVRDFADPTGCRYQPVAEHIARYVATDGEDGHSWRGAPTLLLTTLGRRTGTPRQTALIYTVHESAYAVVASNLGADRHPDWYLNAVHTPEVLVQVRQARFVAQARTADQGLRSELWARMLEVWPEYAHYQATTTREIPILVLRPGNGGGHGAQTQ